MGAPDALVSDPTLNLRDVLGVYPLEEVVGLPDNPERGGTVLRYREGVAHLLNRLLETGVADVVHLEPHLRKALLHPVDEGKGSSSSSVVSFLCVAQLAK